MKKPFLEAGQIVSTHGVRGDVKVMPWADDPEFLLDFDTVYLGGKPVRVQSCRVQKTCVLMKLEGVDDLDAAARLYADAGFRRTERHPVRQWGAELDELRYDLELA